MVPPPHADAGVGVGLEDQHKLCMLFSLIKIKILNIDIDK
jgi:hypothetical protein